MIDALNPGARVRTLAWAFPAARPQALALLLLGLGSLGACSDPEAPAPQPNVLLISIDSLRADHLGSYGYGRNTSPAIDGLAAEGVLFEQTMSSTSWTLPSHASLFTGLPIAGHGCDSKRTKLRPAAETLAERLQSAGYRTAGFWSGPYLHPVFGLGQGFDEYVNCASFGYFEDQVPGGQRKANQQSHEDITNPKLTREVLGWLDRRHAESDPKPFLLFVHMWDVHYDFFPPAPYDVMFTGDYAGTADGTSMRKLPGQELDQADKDHTRALYDGEIAWTDFHVGKILKRLEAQGLKDNTLVILTADHGEEFWERGNFGHRKNLFEESVRIPLILRYPPSVPEGIRVKSMTSIVDVLPTVLEVLGLQASWDAEGLQGSSLVPAWRGQAAAPERWIFAELKRPRPGDSRVALRKGDWKLLYHSESQELLGLWDLESDAEERSNRLRESSPESDALRRSAQEAYGKLRKLQERDLYAGSSLDGEQEIPEDVHDALHGLGYVEEDDEESGDSESER